MNKRKREPKRKKKQRVARICSFDIEPRSILIHRSFTSSEPTVCKKDVTNGMAKGFVSQRNGNGKCVRVPSTVKRPCGSPCCSAGRNRKSSSSNSMVFLLHQGDAENICASNETPIRVCGQPVMKKIEIPPCPKF